MAVGHGSRRPKLVQSALRGKNVEGPRFLAVVQILWYTPSMDQYLSFDYKGSLYSKKTTPLRANLNRRFAQKQMQSVHKHLYQHLRCTPMALSRKWKLFRTKFWTRWHQVFVSRAWHHSERGLQQRLPQFLAWMFNLSGTNIWTVWGKGYNCSSKMKSIDQTTAKLVQSALRCQKVVLT